MKNTSGEKIASAIRTVGRSMRKEFTDLEALVESLQRRVTRLESKLERED